MNTPTSPTAKPDVFARLGRVVPRAINIAGTDLTTESFLPGDRKLPLVITPRTPGLDLARWGENNREHLRRRVDEYGGVLLRGFSASTQEHFEAFLQGIRLEVMDYVEGATPRTKVGKDVYTSTEFPADQVIAPHNELSYVLTWPSKILFFCVTAAQQRGETPIVDCLKVYQRIPDEIRQKFVTAGWKLVRNYGTGLGLPWQRAFRTEDRAALERYLEAAGIEFEWLSSERLRTSQTRPAILRHAPTKEFVWFNHIAFWNAWSLPAEVRESMLAAMPPEDLPYNTYYGDGSPISREAIDTINAAYAEETVSFLWQPGDLLFLDNSRVAHARSSFVGPRRILTAMGDPCSDRGLA